MSIKLESVKSRKTSLQKIRENRAGLNKHRDILLSRVPNIGDWAKFRPDTIEIIDLAYLTAKTGHEFALLRGKNQDILLHGKSFRCEFDDILSEMLISGKLRLEAHSHPEEILIPSPDDRQTLSIINQERSIIISAVTGQTIEFTKNQF